MSIRRRYDTRVPICHGDVRPRSCASALKSAQAMHARWYADDATGCDSLERMRVWFDALLEKGPKYGYFPKPSKCILVTKPECLEKANSIFKGTGVSVQTDGSKDSGVEVTIGTKISCKTM